MTNVRAIYDKAYLVKCLAWIAAIVVAMRASGGAGFVIVVPLMLFAFAQRKTEGMFFWLLTTVAMLMGNNNLMPKDMVFGLTQRGLLLLAGTISLTRALTSRSSLLAPFKFIFVYLLFMLLPSTLGWSPIISYLKLFLFSVIYLAYVGMVDRVRVEKADLSSRLRSVMLAFSIFFILGSVFLIPFPGIGMMNMEEIERNPNVVSLFMGMTRHSQSLGPIVSALSVILFADLLFTVQKADKIYLLLLVCCPILIYKTASRTGMGSYLLGMMFVFHIFLKARGVVSGGWKSRVSTGIMIGLIMLFVVSVFTVDMGGVVRNYLLKGGEERMELSLDNVIASRQGLVDSAIVNFKEKPLIGNGFQVRKSMQYEKRNTLASIMSAPVEKGVWVSAVLEEGGICGFLIFFIFLWWAIWGSVKCKAYCAASCLFVFTLSNLGEFVFFSMSYTGGFVWALIFMGLALDIQRQKAERWKIACYNARLW